MTIDAIDFGRLYRDHLAASGRQSKPASAWDARVRSGDRPFLRNDYAEGFIARMDLSGCDSLLDVGCGPGTLCLPLAARLRQIHALDYSGAMLDALERNAAHAGVDNVRTLHMAWEDDWSQVPACDIVLASRSTQVEDMATALAKLHAKARKRVYLTHRVGGFFIDQKIVQVIGRRQLPLPDYIYVLNILHGMGIHPRVDYLRSDAPAAAGSSFDDLLRRTEWSLGPLDEVERSRLQAWYDTTDAPLPHARPDRHWAFISWEKESG
ncbi:MAG: class I SAM-dependent methyltransferase [Stenotrophomonas sp.]